MIADAAQALEKWIAAAVSPVPIRSIPPGADNEQSADSIVCYLESVSPSPITRGTHRGPLQFDLLFLVAAVTRDAASGYRLMDAVIGAAARRTDVEFVAQQSPPELWRRFGVATGSSLAIRATARWERPEPTAPLVREPLLVRSTGFCVVTGRVTSPEGVPVAAARVLYAAGDSENDGTAPTARTDMQGRFRFAALPEDAAKGRFVVYARGARHEAAAARQSAGSPGDILLIIDPIGVMT